MAENAGSVERMRRVLTAGPLYEGLAPLVAGMTDAHARRVLNYLRLRGEAQRDVDGTWRLTGKGAAQ